MRAIKALILFGIGGFIYILIELFWRGHTHWTMFIVGGLCFILLGLINEVFTFDMSLLLQMLVGSGIITLMELVSGYIVNIKLGWGVWDYSNMPFNVAGQVCFPYMILWFFLSALGIILDDYLRYWLFHEEKPTYKII